MFWGCDISNGNDFTVQNREPAEDEFGQVPEMLHVSNASLNTGKKAQAGEKYKIFVHLADKKHLVANLVEGRIENYALDLYFRNNEVPKFTVEGKGSGSVSLTGYWEAAPAPMDDDEYGMGPMEMDMLDEEEEADLDPATRENISKAKQNALKNATAGVYDDSDEEEESEEEFKETKVTQIKGPGKKGIKVTETKKATLMPDEDEDDDSDDDEDIAPQLVGKELPAADEDEDSDEDDLAQIKQLAAQAKARAPLDGNSDDDDDEDDEEDEGVNIKKLLANKKRAPDNVAQESTKRQKVDDNKEKKHNKHQHKQHHQNKGNAGKGQHNQGQHNQGGKKKRHNKNKNKNK